MKRLLEVISTIGKHGCALIVGRDANFIPPAEDMFSVRVIAPMEMRVCNAAHAHRVTSEEAKRRVIRRESRRKAFVRQSFHADINDPSQYHMVINTDKMSVAAVMATLVGNSP